MGCKGVFRVLSRRQCEHLKEEDFCTSVWFGGLVWNYCRTITAINDYFVLKVMQITSCTSTKISSQVPEFILMSMQISLQVNGE